MGLSNNIALYSHVKPVLDAALRAKGAIYNLPDPKSAIRWRAEAYKFRQLAALEGNHGYEQIYMTIDDTQVKIVIRDQPGILTTHDGTILEVAPTKSLATDELEREAQRLADKLFEGEMDLEVGDDK